MTTTVSTLTRAPILQYRSLIWNFAQRDLKARFKGTAMGWAWSLILPIASLLTYTLVAHYIFRAAPPDFGNGHKGNFAVWLFVGLTAWGFFANGLNTSIGALLGTGALLKKIYFPSYAPVLGAIIGVAIQSAIELGLVLVVLSMFGNVGLSWLLLPFWAVLFLGFVAGLSLVLSIANIYFRDLAHLVSVFLQLLFYATPVLYQDSLITNPDDAQDLDEQPAEPVREPVPRPRLRADAWQLEELGLHPVVGRRHDRVRCCGIHTQRP